MKYDIRDVAEWGVLAISFFLTVRYLNDDKKQWLGVLGLIILIVGIILLFFVFPPDWTTYDPGNG
jgi:uncharacterized membrane protein HdeD (DUF308 family)